MGFERLVVEVTRACQHSCLHCYNHWREERGPVLAQDTLTREEIRTIIGRARCDAPITQVALSGGEPLLRDDLPEIVGDLTNVGISVVVITNGGLLSDRRLARFPRGIVFETTLFAADARLHDRIAGRRGAFRKVLNGAACIQRHGSHLAVALVLTRLNVHDVRRTMELGIALGTDAFLLNRVNLSRLTLPVADRLVPSARQLREALGAAETIAQDYGAMVAVSVPIPPCVLDTSIYGKLHFGWCPRGGNGAYYTISHNGLLRPCNHSSVILGDLRRQQFAEIVSSAKTRRFWKPIPPKCRTCQHPLGKLCRGGCPAASHECYGKLNRRDPIIDYMSRESACPPAE